jgi:hypothetical protein
MSNQKKTEPKLDLDRTREKLARLGLEHVAKLLEDKLSAAARDEIPPYRFLDEILDDELGSREERRIPSQSAVRKALGEDLVKAKVKDLKNRLSAVDFHSLHHTFLTNLARAGVHPKTAQTLARHSTITLTLDRYTRVSLGDEVRAIESLPRLTGRSSSKLRATGTDGAMQPGCLGDLLGQTGAGARRSPPFDAASRGQEAGEWYAREDSNLRLSDPKSDALSS